jgi:ferredoxin-NADP reductase
MSAILKDNHDVAERAAGSVGVQNVHTRLLRRREIADDTMAFWFERPPQFRFQAGQAVSLTLRNPPETDAKGNRRTFSIASSPLEKDIMVVSRMRDSAFKRTLRTMPLGAAVQLRGPIGNFTLTRGDRRPVVFLAGGIGITPFVSMLREQSVQGMGRRIYLFYSNRTPGSSAFLDELTELAVADLQFRLLATVTDVDVPAALWNGHRGFISKDMLVGTVEDLLEPDYYVAGPPPMTAAMVALLTDASVPQGQIHTDEFFGY